MATRMQQRRGTAAQWTSANPILNAGEMGWESDTNKFKIGDGTNHWADIDYFIDQSSTVNPAFGSSITFEGATANNFETTLSVTDPTADRTLTLPDETGTIATTTYVDNALAQTNTHDAVQATTASNLSATYAAGSADSSNGTGVGATLTMSANGAFAVDGYSASSGDRILVKNQTTSTQNGIYTVTTVGSGGTAAVLTRATDYNNTPGGEVEKGDFVFVLNGTVNQNVGFMMTATGTNADGSIRIGTDAITWTQVSALGEVDAGTGLAKSGNTIYVDTTVIQARVTDVSDTEIGYLNGVTSAIQTQLDAKTATGHAHTSADITGFTEDVQDAIGNVVGPGLSYNDTTGAISVNTSTIQAKVADVSDTEIGYLNGVTSAIQTQIDAKAPTNDPTFTGTVSLPTTTSVGDVSSTELQYVNGVTSLIQVQLDAKAGTSHTHLLAAGATDVTASASELNILDGVTSSTAELNILDGVTASTTELNYVDGVTSAIQTQIDAKAASSHTHAQADITNLTSDLAAKAALSGATFTGAVVLAADPSTALGAATKQYVDSLAEGLHVHASVVAATTANITLATAVENGDTLDGVTLATGNRILVKNQSTASENGIYVVAASGAPSRATDFDAPAEIDGGDFVFVTGGTVNDNTGWVQTNIVGTVGTDAIAFSQFAGAGTVTAGTNVSVTGNQVSVINDPTFSGVVTASASGVAFSDGTQTKAGVPSITPRVEASDSYNLSTGGLTLRDSFIEISKATGVTLTIPTNATTAFPVGTSIDVLQVGAGQVTIAGAVGVTVNATPGLKLRAQWSSATLFKRATDTWIVMGDLSA